MDRRATFNENVQNYEAYRPTYPQELYDAIRSYSDIGPKSYGVEVGIGTGQATLPILQTGCRLTAVELGSELAAYTEEKFRQYTNFDVVNCSFETYDVAETSVDLVYSATAFHWIPVEVGYPKIHRMLKTDGTLALFWNRPSTSQGPLHEVIQKVYAKYWGSQVRVEESRQKAYDKVLDQMKSYGFRDIRLELFKAVRCFDADSYIGLLTTYSDHRSMPESMKEPFYSEIRKAINRYGGVITIEDTVDLYLGKK